MLHGSGSWPVWKENEVTLQRAELRMVRWMCDVKVKDWVPNKELREGLGLDDIISVLQQNRLHWYGHMLHNEDSDWVKKCMEYGVEGARPSGRPKRTWIEAVQKDYQVCKLNREDAVDHSRWRKLLKDGWWSGKIWIDECFFSGTDVCEILTSGNLQTCLKYCHQKSVNFANAVLWWIVGCNSWLCVLQIYILNTKYSLATEQMSEQCNKLSYAAIHSSSCICLTHPMPVNHDCCDI